MFSNITGSNLFKIAIGIFISYFLVMRIFIFNDFQFTFYEGIRKVAFYRLDSIAFGVAMAFALYYFKEKILSIKGILFVLGMMILVVNQYWIFKDFYSNLYYFNTFYYTILGVGLCLLFPILLL